MIYSSTNNIRHIGGRLGNQVMRIMAMMQFSKKYGVGWAIPTWEYTKYFENDIPERDRLLIRNVIQEPHFHYAGEFFDRVNWKQHIDLRGFFQSPKYWDEKLRFKKGYLSALRRKYDFGKNPIAVSVRRGDFVGNKVYYQLPAEYYIGALQQHFPDYNKRLVFCFSDDIEWSMEHFVGIENVCYINAAAIEQLAVMTLCKDFVISQSTFSYMGAYLADAEKVIRPLRNFDGAYARKNSEQDFWPEGWIIYDHKK